MYAHQEIEGYDPAMEYEMGNTKWSPEGKRMYLEKSERSVAGRLTSACITSPACSWRT